MLRFLWNTAGAASLGLGIAGIALPLVPTTPFVLLAAYCWYRGSPERYAWLLAHPRYGVIIRDWQEHRAIARRTKVVALLFMAAVLVLSLLLDAPRALLVAQIVVLTLVAAFIVTRSERPRG